MYQRAVLKNGLRVVGELIPSAYAVSLGLWVGVGSRDEDEGLEGAAHLIEHMFFKGTGKRTAREIAEAIDAVGGHLNAFTTREYTCFYAKLLSTHITLGLDLLSDMYCDSLLCEEDLKKEKSVVLEEIKSYEDTPDELVHDLLAGSLWPGHPLGRPILGNPRSVSAVSHERLHDFITRFYRPENTVLAVAGMFDFEEFLDAAAQRFTGIKTGKSEIQRHTPTPAPGRKVVNRDTKQVHLCLGGRGVARNDPDKYPVNVVDSIIGGSISSRLFQTLREDRGLVYATGSTHSTFSDTGIFSIYAGTAPSNVDQVLKLIVQEIDGLLTEPLDAEELSRAKEQLRGNYLLGLEGTSAHMSRLAKMELFGEPLRPPEEVLERIEAVTLDDVRRLVEFIFSPKPLAMAVVAPRRAKLDLMDALTFTRDGI